MSLDLRLALPAVLCWAAAGVMIAFCELAWALALVLWLATTVTVVCMLVLRRTRVSTVLQLVGICFAGCALVVIVIAVVAPSRYPEQILNEMSGGRAIGATVEVTGNPKAAPGSSGFAERGQRYSFRGTAASISIGQDTQRVAVPVLVFATGAQVARHIPMPRAESESADRDIRIGSVVTIRGTGQAQLSEDGVALMIFARGIPVFVSDPPLWLDWANELRAGFARAAASLPGEGGGLLPGLAIGDTSAVSEKLDDAMKSSSLSHLTAVSGANCAVVVAAMMMLGAAAGLRRGVRIAVAIMTLAGFVILVTPEGSVLRASVMAVVVMISLGSGRSAHGLPALSFAVILLLALDPWLARNYGFALSVLATAGLLTLAGPIGESLGRWMPKWMGLVIAIPLAAQLACQPVLVLLDPSLSLFGVVANVLAAPAAPVATMIGLVGCLLLAVAPGLGQACLQVAWVPSAWIATVAIATSEFPASRLPWLEGAAGLGAIACITVLALYLMLRRPSAPRTVVSLSSLLILLLISGAYTGVLVGTRVARQFSVPAQWQVAACDIGQGDAVVVRSGALHALVDVGPDPELLSACLERLDIDRIDLLVLTHYDFDHVGGVQAVLGRTNLVLVGPPDSPSAERLLDSLRETGARVVHAHTGMTGGLAALRWQILWPRQDSSIFASGNPGSVVISFEGEAGDIRSVFLGDLGEDAQRALMARNNIQTVDVVKVAHHGSSDQSDELYRRLNGVVGLISVGADNNYGHPSQRLLSVLVRAGTIAQRTDLQGMIVISPPAPGSDALRVWSERSG